MEFIINIYASKDVRRREYRGQVMDGDRVLWQSKWVGTKERAYEMARQMCNKIALKRSNFRVDSRGVIGPAWPMGHS